jgi:hypothetical protein
MARSFPIQTNFTSGEVSKDVSARVDVNKYFNGAEKLENFIVKPQGGAYNRSGTQYVYPGKYGTKETLTRRFEFSVEQAYVIEFGDRYFRVYRNGGIVLSGGVPVEVTTPYNAADLRSLKFTQSADVLYITHPLYRTRKITRTSHTSWTISVINFNDGPYLDENSTGTVFTVDTVVSRATLRSTNNDFVVGDVGKFVEFIHEGKLLIGEIKAYVSGTEVTIEPKFNVVDPASIDTKAKLDFMDAVTDPTPAYDRVRSTLSIFGTDTENSYIKVDGVWYFCSEHKAGGESIGAGGGIVAHTLDIMEVTVTPTMIAAPTGLITYSDQLITARLQSSTNTFDSARDVGRLFRMRLGVKIVWGEITNVSDAMTCTVELGNPFPSDPEDPSSLLEGGRTSNWRLGAWYTDNYPSVVTFHEERLTFANTPLQPQTMWMSVSQDYENMAPTDSESEVLDDSAINYTMVAKKVNAIRWLESGPVLLLGTSGAEWQAKASTINETITPTNINVLPQTPYGSTQYVDPERVGSAILFVDRSGSDVRELTYSFEVDSYVANHMTVLSEHILEDAGGALEVAYQQHPDPIFWVVTNSGDLVAMTYDSAQQVAAWFRVKIGGGSVKSIAVIPSADSKQDEVWLVVERTINGNTVKYIEILQKPFTSRSQTIEEAFFVDSGLTYNGTATSTVTGLDHLEGQTVKIVADGSVRPDEVVSGGSVTFEGGDATTVHVGLGYTAILKILPLEAATPNGTAQGKIKRIDELIIRLLDTVGFLHGPDEANLDQESFRDVGDPMDEPVELFSGDRKVPLDTDYDTTGQYVIVQNQPYPCKILALMGQMNITE